MRVDLLGAVQGVGCRPLVYRLARDLGLAGWIRNSGQGLAMELEGPSDRLERLLACLQDELPPPAEIHELRCRSMPPAGFKRLEILPSQTTSEPSALVLGDLAACPACMQDVLQEGGVRFAYPFTNCTHCGPRYSIVLSLPYDRRRTTMRAFEMCARCRQEYESPADRRFHAQPNACPDCGPQLSFASFRGRSHSESTGGAAIAMAADVVRAGDILAVKGLGGFHLLADAASDSAVARLRRRKLRSEKPLALMVQDLSAATQLCVLGELERQLLTSREAPIVLAPKRKEAVVSDSVAGGSPDLGLMLPYTPLHHLLMREIGAPVVATSGNLSEEPICIDNQDALDRLGPVADAMLSHNRDIARPVEDSVVQVVDQRPQRIRQGRGASPLTLTMPCELPPILALGADLKNTIALSRRNRVFVSQHLGDLSHSATQSAFLAAIADLLAMYPGPKPCIAHDLHPGYVSTQWARRLCQGTELGNWATVELAACLAELKGATTFPVQHHQAHLAATLADHQHEGPALGVIWDGAGYGLDGTTWGGEFLVGDATAFQRWAHLKPLRLLGGDQAVRQPQRVALALLWEALGDDVWRTAWGRRVAPAARQVFSSMLQRGVCSPQATSAGRLFDGVAFLLGVAPRVTFEGQAAMALEHLARTAPESASYVLPLEGPADCPRILNWSPLVAGILEDLGRGVSPAVIAAGFHDALGDAILSVALDARRDHVVLAGGCFQNRLLAQGAAERLRDQGFHVLLPHRLPANDGAISLGQLIVAAQGDS